MTDPVAAATPMIPVASETGQRVPGTRRIAPLSYVWAFLACAAVCAAVLLSRMHVEMLGAHPHALMPQPVITGKQVQLSVAGYVLTAEVTTYKDELFAYLMFDYLRHDPAFANGRLLLTFDVRDIEAPYRLVFSANDDLRSGLAAAASLAAAGTLRSDSVRMIPQARVSGFEQQTRLFELAYNMPVRKKLEQLPRTAVAEYLRRFIRFKSVTDPRIRRKLEPVPSPLSATEARQVAGDILIIAGFYSLPLEFFLAIGAVENNYMNVRGDLQHSIWKRRPAPDDIVLEKKRGRVRVLNDSAGVWQITRETLRYAHSLYRRDDRDYSTLPEHLRPPDQLDVEEISPQVLTTYAGVLLRDLLDRFDGDVTLAVSAYNGGPARPNLRYGGHVHRAAEHARKIVESAAALNGETVVRMTWLRRP